MSPGDGPVTDTVRAFLALEIPDTVKKTVEAARDEVRRTLPAARWTRPEGWHLTLKFLGDSERNTLGHLIRDLGPRLVGLSDVAVELPGGGFFPSPARPRVAWIGGSVAGAAPVVEAVEAAAVRVGYPGEVRPWSAHLTIARLKGRWPAAAIESYLAWTDGLAVSRFVCTDVVLFESRLGQAGAVYTALERMPLE
jgi:2'-5' RNA ligase